jgi:CRISPR-associated protein Csm5
MLRFIDSQPLVLTPLTPIHIGCGEDFEPTNYVIEDGVLYQFDPAQVHMTEVDRKQLLQAVSRRGDDAIRAVQSFFYGKRAECKKVSRRKVPVAAGVAEWYASRVGRVSQREGGGRTVSNQLEIERTAHHPHTGRPYIPGSSLKGSIRTAWLNHLDPSGVIEREPDHAPSERSDEIEAELLGGRFATDPFRLVKLTDASGSDVGTRIVFSVDRDKEQRLDRNGRRTEKNLFVRREVIIGGQYRALSGEIRFDLLPGINDRETIPARNRRVGGFETLARACNRFYTARLGADLSLIRRRFADDPWVDRFERLVQALTDDLEAGRSMLLRVGRHSGAESVTLEKRRGIRIKGRGGRHHWARDATTIWLAAEREDSRAELLPFGWLLLERADSPENAELRRWCEREAQRYLSTSTPVPAESVPDALVPSSRSVSDETVWERARLKFNARNGTLTAVGPNNAEANALAPRGAELLASLPPDVQRRVKANEFVRVTAKVRGAELIAVEAKA